jgi:hypothetical protein
MDFMHWINLVQRHSWLPDGVIVLKLLTILTDGAPLWFKTMEASHKNKKRSFWCGELCKKYGTSSWKRKKEDTFDQDKFVAGKTVPEEWVTRQYNRLECFSPGLSQGSINYKLLKLMDSKVEFAVKTAMQNTEADLSELTHILEDICNKIQIGRRRFVPKDVDTPKILPATASKPKAPGEPLTCYLCGAKGHTSRRCPKKVNAVDGDEPLPDDEAGSEYDPGEPIIGVIRLSSGKNNLVQMLCCEKECFVLLDSGAVRSVVGKSYLAQFCPGWQNFVLPVQTGSFHSASGAFLPLGVVNFKLIFKNIKLVIKVVVMENMRAGYFILGNDYLAHYKISLLNADQNWQTHF